MAFVLQTLPVAAEPGNAPRRRGTRADGGASCGCAFRGGRGQSSAAAISSKRQGHGWRSMGCDPFDQGAATS